MNCQECPFKDRPQYKAYGRKNGILFVRETPDYSKRELALINTALSAYDLEDCPVFYGASLKCAMYEDSTKDINKSLKLCKQFLFNQIETVKPIVIATLGSIPLSQLDKTKKVMKNRGSLCTIKDLSYPVIPMVSPLYSLKNATGNYPNKPYSSMTIDERMFFDDVKTLSLFIKKGETAINIDTSNYKEITEEDLDILEKQKVIAIDIETNGLGYGNDCKVLSISFSYMKGKSSVFLLKPNYDKQILNRINNILSNKNIAKVIANKPFDNNMWEIFVGTKWEGKIHDVLILAHLIDENMPTSYSLENVANAYTDLKNIKTIAEGQRFDLEKATDDLKIRYNGVDTDATLQAYNKLASLLLKDKKLYNYYLKFILPVTDMYSDISKYGFKMDLSLIDKTTEELQVLEKTYHQEAIDLLPEFLKLKHSKIKKNKDGTTQEVGLKLTRSALIRDMLFTSNYGIKEKPLKFTSKTGLPAIDEAHLNNFKDLVFVQKVLNWKKVEKVLTTYIPQIKKAINKDGKIYPSTLFTNTVTGRTVMLNPTIQTIPQRGPIAPYVTKLFKAEEGWLFNERDLAQSELRIIGWIAKDPNILKALHSGIDLHSNTAMLVNGLTDISKVTKADRQKAKPINFGFIYGMLAKSFVIYAKDMYGQIFTQEEAEIIRNNFFGYPNGYYKLLEYHNNQITFARKNGYVRTILGRIRRLPEINSADFYTRISAERQAINAPIQSVSSDIALIGKFLFHKYIKEHELDNKCRLLWFIHDAIKFLTTTDFCKEAHNILDNIYKVEVPNYIYKNFGIEVGYPIESEGKVGNDWSNMKEVE